MYVAVCVCVHVQLTTSVEQYCFEGTCYRKLKASWNCVLGWSMPNQESEHIHDIEMEVDRKYAVP